MVYTVYTTEIFLVYSLINSKLWPKIVRKSENQCCLVLFSVVLNGKQHSINLSVTVVYVY